jgi:hypothetical protein
LLPLFSQAERPGEDGGKPVPECFYRGWRAAGETMGLSIEDRLARFFDEELKECSESFENVKKSLML